MSTSRAPIDPPHDHDWAWDWQRGVDDRTDPFGAPTVPATTRVCRASGPRLSRWTRPFCIVATALLAAVVVVILLNLSMPFELPSTGTSSRPRPTTGGVTSGIGGSGLPTPTAVTTTPTTAPPSSTSSVPTTRPRPGTVTNVPPTTAAASPTPPTAPPPTSAPPPTDQPRNPLLDLLP